MSYPLERKGLRLSKYGSWAKIERRAAAEAMAVGDFAAGAVRDFVERADDELWLQLLTVMRNAEDPGLAAIQSILRWVAASEQRAT